MNKVMILLLAILAAGLQARVLTLHDCYEKARDNHPRQEEKIQQQTIYDLNTKNLNSNYLPSLSINANAVYMSDVVEFGNVLSSLPIQLGDLTLGEMPKDQYKATLDVNQLVYDGGMVRCSKALEKAALEAELSALDVEFYKIYDQVNQVYFSLLLLDKQREMAIIFQEQIEQQKKSLQSAVDNGMMLPNNVDILQAELLKIEQQLCEIGILKNQLLETLATLIGETVENTSLQMPQASPQKALISRPELALFSTQQYKLNVAQKLNTRVLYPKIAAFGSLGYGNPPGNDFFTNEFDTYYSAGIGLSWTPFDWNKTKRNKKVLAAQQHILTARENEFRRGIKIMLDGVSAEIDKYEKMLKTDIRLVALRERITRSAESSLNNGNMTSTEYLTELNQERQARINHELHTIQLAQAKINHMTISGQFYKEN